MATLRPALRLAFLLMVAVMTTSVTVVAAQGGSDPQGPVGVWSIQSRLNQELFLQCRTDLGSLKFIMIPPLGNQRESWYPEANAYLSCIVYTGIPEHYGNYDLYVRNPAFRACYNDCSWIADESGLTLMSEGGLKYRTHYDWQRKGN